MRIVVWFPEPAVQYSYSHHELTRCSLLDGNCSLALLNKTLQKMQSVVTERVSNIQPVRRITVPCYFSTIVRDVRFTYYHPTNISRITVNENKFKPIAKYWILFNLFGHLP